MFILGLLPTATGLVRVIIASSKIDSVSFRESTKCFGDTATRLYQVSPQFKLLSGKIYLSIAFNMRLNRGLFTIR
jgi:hypothetical protein